MHLYLSRNDQVGKKGNHLQHGCIMNVLVTAIAK